ncbi:MAG: hypothetical protein HY744_02610 [Deltaproteobacteria bacterium]|nr:hypothetical protein [Deltaproteobacteria bacterium]
MSAGTWGSEDLCKTSMRASCSDADRTDDCELDDEALDDCESNIEGSPCGSLPQSCYDLHDCLD